MKEKVLSIVDKYGTNDPLEIAERMGIEVIFPPLESANVLGMYANIFGQRVIVCNGFLTPPSRSVILAHELGHAVQHDGLSMFFVRDNTLFPAGKLEYQANKFAAELLIPDSVMKEYAGYTVSQIASAENIHPKLFEYKTFDPSNETE